MSDTPQDDSRREGRHIVQYHIDRDPKSEQTDSRDDGHERRQPAPQAPQADGGDDPAGHGPPRNTARAACPGLNSRYFGRGASGVSSLTSGPTSRIPVRRPAGRALPSEPWRPHREIRSRRVPRPAGPRAPFPDPVDLPRIALVRRSGSCLARFRKIEPQRPAFIMPSASRRFQQNPYPDVPRPLGDGLGEGPLLGNPHFEIRIRVRH